MKQFLKNNKAIILLSLGLGLILIGWFSTRLLKKDDQPEAFQSKINTNITVGEGKDVFGSKVDAYEQEILDSSRTKGNNSNNLENFGKLNAQTGKLTKEQMIQRKIDSTMKANSIVYEEPTKKRTSDKKRSSGSQKNSYSSQKSSSNNSTTTVREREKSQKEKELDELREWESQMKQKTAQSNINSSKNKTVSSYTDPKIQAIINGDQELTDGERVNLRLTNDCIINDIKYPKNTMLNGFVKFGKNRLFITVNSISGNSVDLDVFDGQDGSPGLYTKENLLEKSLNQANDDALNEVKSSGTAGKIIDAGADLLKKKNKPVSILLLNRTSIILKPAQ